VSSPRMTLTRTARLTLRPIEARDAPPIVAGCSDSEVARYIPVMPVPYAESDAREWLAGAEEHWRTERERSFAVTFTDEGELLGVVSVRLRPDGSVGYWMRPEARGQGIMSGSSTQARVPD
jgi:RimJ/RimL family protein N-acetyltransferase